MRSRARLILGHETWDFLACQPLLVPRLSSELYLPFFEVANHDPNPFRSSIFWVFEITRLPGHWVDSIRTYRVPI